MTHLQIGDPQITIGGRKLEQVGTSLIVVTPEGGTIADIVAGANGISVSKISNMTEIFTATIPIARGSEDDRFLQGIIKSREIATIGGFIACKIITPEGSTLDVYQIYNFIIPNTPEGGISYSVENIGEQAYMKYTIKFAGERTL